MEKSIPVKNLMKRIRALENSLKISEEHAEKLERRIRALGEQKKMLMEEEKKKNEIARKSVLGGKEIALRDTLIRSLQTEREALKKKFSKIDELEMISSDGCVPVMPMGDFDKDSILEKNRTFGINGSIIFFGHAADSNTSAAKILVSLQPKAVIANLDDEASGLLKNAEIRVIKPKNIRLRKYLDFYGADRAEFEREVRRE